MDFLGMKLAMDIDFILTFVSQSNPTAQVSIVRWIVGGNRRGVYHDGISFCWDQRRRLYCTTERRFPLSAGWRGPTPRPRRASSKYRSAPDLPPDAPDA